MLPQIKYAINSLRKNKIYTIINISGLALGMAVAIALTMIIIGLFSFDQFHENKDSVFKLIHTDDSTTNDYNDASSALLAPAVKEEIPEVIDYCQYIQAHDKIIGSPENYVKENGFYVDEGWFRMLTFPLLYGNIEHVLSKPDNIVLSEKLSKKLFGDINPLGQSINLYSYETDKPESFKIAGVYKDLPPTSSLQFQFAIPFEYYKNQNPDILRWTYIGIRSYIKIQPNTNPVILSRKITKLIRSKHSGMEEKKIYGLAPLSKSNGIMYKLTGEPFFAFYTSIAMGIIGLSILIISIINYINLSVANSFKRSKEIGMRKINGAGRKELAIQFFIETTIVVVIAAFLASFLQSFILKIFMTDTEMPSFFGNTTLYLILIGLSFFTILFTAWYPAIYMSKFSPLTIQKKTNDGKYKLSFSRRFMVTFQFITAIVLITTSIILSRQVDYILNKSVGMDRFNIVYFTKDKQLEQHRDAFTQELRKNPGIESVSFSNQLPIMIGDATTGINWEGKDPNKYEWYNIINVGENFAQTMRMEITDGRDLNSGDINKILVNESAVKKMEMQNPVGNSVNVNGNNSEIVGVIKNFNFNLMSTSDQPLFITYHPESSNLLLVKLEDGNETAGLKSLQKIFNQFSPDFILDYTFLDHTLNENYKQIKNMKFVMTLAGYLAVIIACLGLLGLTVHASERRVKELGVRKINGAKIKDLIGLLSEQMLKSILVAAIIAYPLVYLLNKAILENFPERIEISFVYFIWSMVLLFVLTSMIVGWQIVRAARRNPVEALRYE